MGLSDAVNELIRAGLAAQFSEIRWTNPVAPQ